MRSINTFPRQADVIFDCTLICALLPPILFKPRSSRATARDGAPLTSIPISARCCYQQYFRWNLKFIAMSDFLRRSTSIDTKHVVQHIWKCNTSRNTIDGWMRRQQRDWQCKCLLLPLIQYHSNISSVGLPVSEASHQDKGRHTYTISPARPSHRGCPGNKDHIGPPKA